ncbi:hypothetical protein [Streptomyces sp. NPDC056663]|uniref:hypothetical protein n=1 Tax=Streptomyces sp. NPDC056663 TaxID=3345899 RepID=UPI0036A578F1
MASAAWVGHVRAAADVRQLVTLLGPCVLLDFHAQLHQLGMNSDRRRPFVELGPELLGRAFLSETVFDDLLATGDRAASGRLDDLLLGGLVGGQQT